MKKLISTVLAGTFISASLVGLVGCRLENPNNIIDADKVQLYVANYNGGIGDKWLYSVKERFEEEYSDYQLDGKTGVQVILDSDKDCGGKTLSGTIGGDPNEVYFTQQVNYEQFVGDGLIRDITGLVTAQNAEDGNKKIVDKFYDSDKENLSVDGKYYAIPHYEFYVGLTYDAYMFESEKLYFADTIAADGTRDFIINKNTKKSCGPDGKYNTYDDGLPSSYQEFYKMLDKVKTKGYAMVFSGEQTHYSHMLPTALYANYVGVDGVNVNLNFNSNGKELEVIKSFSGTKPNITKEVISEENGNQYLINNQAGIYYGLELAAKIFGDPSYYYPDSASGSFSFISAQEAFLESGLSGGKRIAMFIDGSYWYNEAVSYGTVDRIAEDYVLFATQKDPRFMPLPRQYSGTVTEGNGATPVLVDGASSYAFINATTKPEKVDLAEKFLAFCYTDEELINFTKNSGGTIRAVNYDYASVESELSGFGKSVFQMRLAAKEGGTFVRESSTHPTYIKHKGSFSLDTAYTWLSSPNCGNGYNHLWTAVYQGGKSAQDYFKGMWITESDWNTLYK